MLIESHLDPKSKKRFHEVRRRPYPGQPQQIPLRKRDKIQTSQPLHRQSQVEHDHGLFEAWVRFDRHQSQHLPQVASGPPPPEPEKSSAV